MRAAAPLRVLPAQLARRPRAGASRAATCALRAGRPALRATVCSSSRALSAAVAEKAAASSGADKAVALALEPAPPRFGSSIPRGDTAGAALVIEDVSVQAGDRDLLTDASMRVLPGQRVGLVGAEALPMRVARVAPGSHALTTRFACAQVPTAAASRLFFAQSAACGWRTAAALRAPQSWRLRIWSRLACLAALRRCGKRLAAA